MCMVILTENAVVRGRIKLPVTGQIKWVTSLIIWMPKGIIQLLLVLQML